MGGCPLILFLEQRRGTVGFGQRQRRRRRERRTRCGFLARCEREGDTFFTFSRAVGSADCLWDRLRSGRHAERRRAGESEGQIHGRTVKSRNKFLSPLHSF
jgi:hypothetical protein